MRFILWLGLTLGVLWGAYWFVGSQAIEAGAGQWVADMQAQGLTVEQDGIAVSGFPSRFDLTVTRPSLEDVYLELTAEPAATVDDGMRLADQDAQR